MTSTREWTIALTEDRTEAMISVPFEVSEPPLAIHVTLSGPEKAILDLGLADPDRIRGWSGGARRDVAIGWQAATPGYLAGPLRAGHWAVLLGLYRLPPEPSTATVTVTIESFDPRWIPGDLHVHSEHSDGAWTLPQLFAEAQAASLEFIALTDHNTSSQNRAAFAQPLPITVIPGMEWTTQRGHANIWGLSDPLPDWRVTTGDEVASKLQDLDGAGALVSLNHPFDRFQPGIAWEWEAAAPAGIEIWNGPWRPGNQQALDWWSQRLERGERVVAVGGSDVHGPGDLVHIGRPTTWVWADAPGPDGILRGIRQGRVFMTDAPDSVRLDTGSVLLGDEIAPGTLRFFLAGLAPGDRVRWVGGQGVLTEFIAQHDAMEIQIDTADQPFVRLEVHRWRADWETWLPRLISNPVYISQPKGARSNDPKL